VGFRFEVKESNVINLNYVQYKKCIDQIIFLKKVLYFQRSKTLIKLAILHLKCPVFSFTVNALDEKIDL
jgi:hypothetical protein